MILCGWLKRWWKESLQLMEGFDFTIIGIIRECLKLNMYPEAGEILSLDFRSVTDNKSFWSEYYEVRGQFYLDQSLYEKAEDAISKSIRLYRELMEEDPDSKSGNFLHLVHDLRNLASIHHLSGKDKEAEKELREALKISRIDPDNADAVVEVLTDQAKLHFDLLQYDKAENDLDKALAIHKKTYSRLPDSFRLSQDVEDAAGTIGDHENADLAPPETLKILAKLHSVRGKYEDAEYLLNAAVDKYGNLYYEDRPEEIEPYIADTKRMLAEVHHKLGADDEAETELLGCLNVYRNSARKSPMVFAEREVSTLDDLAALYRDVGRNAESEEKWIEALKIGREHAMRNPELFNRSLTATLAALASAPFDLTRHDELKAELDRLPDILRQPAEVAPERCDSDLALLLDSIADVFDKLGCHADAKNARLEAADIPCKTASGS